MLTGLAPNAAQAQTVPMVEEIRFTSSPRRGDTYFAGEKIEVDVRFSEEVTVTTNHGRSTPTLALTVGTETRQATYVPFNEPGTLATSTTLTFNYMVQESDRDTNGIAIPANAIIRNGAVIRTRDSLTNADLDHAAVADNLDHLVSGDSNRLPPVVGAVFFANAPSSGDTYRYGETIAVSVAFNRQMRVTGSPRMALTIGTETRQATYLFIAPGGKEVIFTYEVQGTDRDTDGISIPANTLALGGGTIRDLASPNLDAHLNHAAVSDDASRKVDGQPTASIAWSGGFTENTANDGSVTGTVSATLTGDTFAADVVSSAGHVTASNVPVGLTASFTRTSATVVTLTLSGNATSHTNANDVSTLTVTFANTAFTNGTAATVAGSTKDDIAIDFNDSPPLPPTNLRATANGQTAINLSWTTPVADPATRAAVTGYKVEVSETGNHGTWTQLDTTDSTATTYKHSDLSGSTTRHYQVIATSTAGDSPPSNVATATTAADLMPSFGADTIADQAYLMGTAIASLTLPAATGGDGTLSYTLTGAGNAELPMGLTFMAPAGSTAGSLTGTPTTTLSETLFTLTATDEDGDVATLTFNITVAADLMPSFGTDTVADQAYIQDTAISTLNLPQAASGNGTITYTLTGLPTGTGLSFNAATRQLSGTPNGMDLAASPITLTYIASDADGNTANSDTASLSFIVIVESPEISTLPPQTVPPDWPLIPPGVNPGDSFRVMFVTSFVRSALNHKIAPYNSFVQRGAALGHTAIRSFSGQFRVVGCTDAVSARTNTLTRAIDMDAPIYWLNGDKVADNYADFYNNTWDSRAAKNRYGRSTSPRPLSTFWTGCNSDGTSHATQALGKQFTWGTRFGDLRDGRSPLSHSSFRNGPNKALLGLSPVLTVMAAPDTAPDFDITPDLDQTYTQGTAIASLTLPQATGGNGTITYTLTGLPTGTDLSFNAATRQLSGAPNGVDLAASPITLTYIASDADANTANSDTASLSFVVTVVESLTSLPTLTVAFEGVPPEHDGQSLFTFQLRFSDEPENLSLATVDDSLLTVGGGRVTQAKRVTTGSNQAFTIHVQPTGLGDVTVALRTSLPCGQPGAVCTADGRRLAGGAMATIQGPASLSVADAAAQEGPGAMLAFTVTLSRARHEATTVDYATADGTATAGADYTQTSGTLTFAPGETEKTVSVPILDDGHDDDGETLTLSLSNPVPAAYVHLGDATATGTISNDDAIPQAWMARFARTVADQVVEAVEGRMETPPTPGRQMVLAGIQLNDGNGQQSDGQQMAGLDTPTVNEADLLTSSSFALTANAEAADPTWSIWGQGAVTSFDGREGDLILDGTVSSALLGADWTWDDGATSDGEALEDGRWRAGLLLSHSRGEGRYDTANNGDDGDNGSTTAGNSGKVKAHLTGLFPWVRRALNHRLAAWGLAGYGLGEITVTPKRSDATDAAPLTADLNLRMVAGGLRGTLMDGGSNGITLTGKTDAMLVASSSAEVTGHDGNLASAEATVTRLRIGLEASRPLQLVNGATLTPSLEAGLRHDGGDAETGFGLDLGGGIALSHPESGLEVELRGRSLLSHAADGFSDRGFSASLAWRQQPDSDLGAALSLSHTMGGAASGGADALLSSVTLDRLAANGEDNLNNQRLEFKLSYGFPAFGERFTLTPELGLGLYDSGQDYRIGWRLTRPADEESFAFSFDATRREDTSNSAAPEHGVEFELSTRF